MQFTDDASVFELKRREDFLAKVRKSPSGQTPSLVRVLREGDQSYSELKLAWIHQGGEGSSVLRNLDEKQQRAAEYLLSKGLIVPTSVSNPRSRSAGKITQAFRRCPLWRARQRRNRNLRIGRSDNTRRSYPNGDGRTYPCLCTCQTRPDTCRCHG
jgi:hypothetical protein